MFSRRGNALVGQEMFAIADAARKVEMRGERVLHLELGSPKFLPPRDVIAETMTSINSRQTGYSSPAGIRELRRRIGAMYGLDIENVVVSPANLLINQFLDITCDEGQTVALFTPAFPTYLAAARHAGFHIAEVPLSASVGFELTGDAIARAIAYNPHAIIVNSANNPTGAVYDSAIMEMLTEECASRGIWLLSDETYGYLCYDRPFAPIGQGGRTVAVASLSKLFAVPGFRVGYAIADEGTIDKLILSNSTLYSCLPEFTQRGCLAGLDTLEAHAREMREHFKPIVDRIVGYINESNVLRCHEQKSAFYLFVNVAVSGMDGTQFCRRLLRERLVAATPGICFGADWKDYVRFAVCGDEEDSTTGVLRAITLAKDARRDRGI